jgi:hypothetical protein
VKPHPTLDTVETRPDANPSRLQQLGTLCQTVLDAINAALDMNNWHRFGDALRSDMTKRRLYLHSLLREEKREKNGSPSHYDS